MNAGFAGTVADSRHGGGTQDPAAPAV